MFALSRLRILPWGAILLCCCLFSGLSSQSAWAQESNEAADWPQWRGPNRDGKSLASGLYPDWPEHGPPLLWTYRNAGHGYSSPAVVGQQLVALGTHRERTIAFSLDTRSGKELRRTEIDPMLRNGWGDGPRSTPTIDGDRIYVLSGLGTLACLERSSGRIVWKKSLTDDFGGEVPKWGYTESPLVDGDRVVVTPGGDAFIVAVNKANGASLLRSSGIQDPAQYSSIVVSEAAGRRMYVTMTSAGVVGIDAETGEFLWRFEKTGNRTAAIPTPIVEEDLIYSTSGYGAGCGLVQLVAARKGIDARQKFFNKVMKNHHGGVILHDGHLYGFSDDAGWICQDFLTGKVVWREKRSLEKGSLCFVQGQLICYGQRDGRAMLIDATPDGWRERGRMQIPEQTRLDRQSGQIWTHPVVADNKLFLRDQDLLFAFDLTDSNL